MKITTKLESGGSTSLAKAPVRIRSSRRMLTKELGRGGGRAGKVLRPVQFDACAYN